MDGNLARIEEVLQREERDQDEVLRRKLEERKNRRKNILGKISETEKVVEEKKRGMEEKKQEVEAKFIEDLASLENELHKEKQQREAALEEDLDRIKREKLE